MVQSLLHFHRIRIKLDFVQHFCAKRKKGETLEIKKKKEKKKEYTFPFDRLLSIIFLGKLLSIHVKYGLVKIPPNFLRNI